jgi:hypothetical protein
MLSLLRTTSDRSRSPVTDFAIQLTKPAVKDLEGLLENVRSDILDNMLLLPADPFPMGQPEKKRRGFKFPLDRL